MTIPPDGSLIVDALNDLINAPNSYSSTSFVLLDFQATATGTSAGQQLAIQSVVSSPGIIGGATSGTFTAGMLGTILGALAGASGGPNSQAGSPLLYTKAAVDSQTYPWLTTAKLPSSQLICCMNDFADNALVSVSIGATRNRLMNCTQQRTQPTLA